MSTPAPGSEPEWQRLDPRMLLVHPVREAVRFLPVVLFAIVVGTGSAAPWELLGVAVPVVVGLLRYYTTTFRSGTERIELRRGLLQRQVVTVPLDRVRTVDLTASLVHRVLGLVTLRIGTGTGGEDDLDLDGLQVEQARRLRERLLRAAPDAGASDPSEVRPAPPAPVLTLDPAWARYAPFTTTGFVVVAGAAGGAGQLISASGGIRLDSDEWDGVLGLTAWLLVPLLLVGLLAAVVACNVAGYFVTNWGFTLGREQGAWHVSRGLLTTRETTLDEERVAGVTVSEPLGLRAAGGARLVAIATGLDREERGSAVLAPPAPRDVVAATAAQVLRTAGPLEAALLPHGPAAVRRRWVRAVGPALVVVAAAALLVLTGSVPAWLLLPACTILAGTVALAADRTRSLGHRLADGHLVTRSGSIARRRDVLDTEHVIGWTFRDTWFQRRAGVVTVDATTAGGRGYVRVLDVPTARAVGLSDAAVPELVSRFTA